MDKLTETEKDYVLACLREKINRILLEQDTYLDEDEETVYFLCRIYKKLTATAETNIYDKQEEVWGR